jgi:hypothetical protein
VSSSQSTNGSLGSVFAPQQSVDQLIRVASHADSHTPSKIISAPGSFAAPFAAGDVAKATSAGEELTSGFVWNLKAEVATYIPWDAAKLEEARLARLEQLDRLGVGEAEPYNFEQARGQGVHWTGSNNIPLGSSREMGVESHSCTVPI